MGFFDKLFNTKQEEKTEQVISFHSKLHDLIFDWFKLSSLDIITFESDFFNKIIEFEIEKGNDWVKEQLNQESNYKIEFKLYSAILYLSYHNPNNEYISSVLEYLFNQDNQAYNIKEKLRYSRNYFKKDSLENNIEKGGTIILGLYHALFLKKDQNFSYLGSITNDISQLKYENKALFTKVFNYLKELKSNDKVFLLGSLYASQKIDYKTNEIFPESEFQEIIKEEGINVFNTFNEKNKYKLDYELYTNFISAVIHRTQTKKWKETAYKKQKFLKPIDFKEIENFSSKYKSESNSVILHFMYYYNHSYIENRRFYKQFINFFIKNSTTDKEWLKHILSIGNKNVFLLQFLFIPLFKKHLAVLTYDDEVRILYEQHLFSNFNFNSPPLKEGVELIKELCKTIQNPIIRSHYLLKYSDYYAILNSPYFYKTMCNNAGFDQSKWLINDLNYLYPVALKNINKNYNFETETIGDIKINIDGKDSNIQFYDINKILFDRGIGFQLVPIPIIKKQRVGTEYWEYLCSLAFVNNNQFKFIIDQNAKNFPNFNMESAYRGIQFKVDTSQTFDDIKLKTLAKEHSNTFESNNNWSWFKEKYIDELSNKENWYKIMSVILTNKGLKKPSENWKKEIKKELKSHKIANFFSELNVLINSSIKEDFWFFDENKQVLKGFIWICQFFPSESSLLILKNIIEAAYTKKPGIGPRSTAIGNLGLKVLVDINSNTSFGILNLLLNKTKYQRFIKAINKHIDLFKESSDEPVEFLADKAIPNFGFINGIKKVTYPEFEIEYFFKNQKLSKRWIFNGKTTVGIPKEIKGKFKEIEKEISEEFKSINIVYKSVKNRIRSFWINNRNWSFVDWNTYILKNEILNPWLENLVWKNITLNESFILKGNEFYSIENELININDNDRIILWHPINSNNKEISLWQKYLLDNKLNQTERQIFREFYPFSENELALTETPRFNDHFLVVRKLMAIANNTGWTFTYVHEDVNWPRIYIKSANITAHLKCDYNRNDFAIPTKGMFFTNEDTSKISYNSKFEKIKLEDLPQTLLSEICRDIDLFIATTSVANDIELSQKNKLLGNYRNDYNYGVFSENASSKVRKSVIELISDKVGLNNITFEGNFLIVVGKINSYRINLGSGFVQTKETKKHINLIMTNSKVKKGIIPIKDDETLNVILAKALLLQNDSDIEDEVLLELIKTV